MSDVVAAIEAAAPEHAGKISYDDTLLPFPDEVASTSLREQIGVSFDTPVQDGVADPVKRFRRLLADGLVSPVAAR